MKKLFTVLAGAFVAAIFALPAQAGQKACFERVFTDQNLADNPGQFVREIRFELSHAEGDPQSYVGILSVLPAGVGAKTFVNSGMCQITTNAPHLVLDCGLDGDAGTFKVAFLARTKLVGFQVVSPLTLFDAPSLNSGNEEEATTITLEPGQANGYFKLHRLVPQACN